MQDELDSVYPLLHSELFEEIPSAYRAKELVPFAGADKHLLASLLQKAIRRGAVAIAQRAGHHLLQIDKRKLWRRVMVTAFEDIGVANLPLAIATIGAATHANWRQRLGGDAIVLDRVLQKLCASLKDRTTDHIGSILNYEPFADRDRCILQRASMQALLAIIETTTLSPIYRIRAALLAAGRAQSAHREPIGDVIDVLERFKNLQVPVGLLEACKIYSRRSFDGFCVILPFLWSLWSKERLPIVENHHAALVPGLDWEIPCYALDPIHTRLGREAIALWRKNYIAPPPWTPRQLAIAVWNFEAAFCDRSLLWPLGEEFRIRAHKADLLARGIPENDHGAITDFVRQEYQTLNCTRWALWRMSNAQEPQRVRSS